jgi:uracil-DNA glycosylase
MGNLQINVRGLERSPGCAGCPRARQGKPGKVVRGFGGTGRLCIVGEGPGQNEIMQGFPFVHNGESGKVLNKALKAANIDRGYVFVTNALLCQRPNNDEEAAVAVACCRERLRLDLERAQPTAICALGGTAMRALQLPVTFVAQARGTVQYSPLAPGVPVIGSIHPAALLRGGAGEMVAGGKQKMNVDAQAMFLFADIAKAAKVAYGTLSAEWSDDIAVCHEVEDTRVAMAAILRDVYEDGILGLDLEWTCDGSKNALDALGADAARAQITWVGVSCIKRAVSFKWEALAVDYNDAGAELPDGAGLDDSALMQLQAAMADPELCKLSHNKQADKAVWEAQVGRTHGRWLDTMLLHHVAYPGIDHDLQQVVSQHLCVPPWKVDHARAIAEHKAQEREELQRQKEIEKEKKKAERMAAHEAKNAQAAADKAAKSARKQADHEERNRRLHDEKLAKKAAKQAAREAADPRQMKLGGVK